MIGAMIGTYRMTEELGDGGAGPVFRAVDPASGREIAVRIFAPDVARDAVLVERLRAMAPVLKRLQHPNVAAVYELVETGASLGFLLEHVAGVNLNQARGQAGRMDTNVAVSCAVQALRGLEHAHGAGVYHHALRPTNLIVTPQGTIKVMDVGIGHVLGANRKTREDRLLSVLAYLAPEQVQNQPGDARSDIYAAGVVLYELLTGRRPFAHRTAFAIRQALVQESAASPRTAVAAIPEWVEQAVMRSLARNPAQRFQNATEMRAVLEAGLGLSTSGSAAVVRDASGPGTATVAMFTSAPAIPPAVAAPPCPPPPRGQSDATVMFTRPPAEKPPVPPPGDASDATVAFTRPAAAMPPAPTPSEPSDATVMFPGPPAEKPPAPPPGDVSDATVVFTRPAAAMPPAPAPSEPSDATVMFPGPPAEKPPAPPPKVSAPTSVPADAVVPRPVAPPPVVPPAAPAPPAPPLAAVAARAEHTAPGPVSTLPRTSAINADVTTAPPNPPAGGPAHPGTEGTKSDAGVIPVGRVPAPPPAAQGSRRRLGVLVVAAVLAITLGAAAGVYWTKFRGTATPAESTRPDASSQSRPGVPAAGPVPNAPVGVVPPPAVSSSAPVTTPAPPPVTASVPEVTPVPTAVEMPAAPKRVPKPKPVPTPPTGGREPVPVVIQPPPPPPPSSPPPVPAEPPPTTPATERQAAAPLPDLSFLKIKLVTRQGEGTREVDVHVMFLEDRVGVSPMGGSATFRSVLYRDMTRATYAREEKRRLFGKSAKHLLTIETAGEPLVLRLDKENFDAVIRAFEGRAKKTVER